MSYKGKWHGTTFRSLLELSLLRHFVEDCGLVIGDTVLYEAHRVPYGREGRRTHIVDFSLPQRKQLIEVKPESRAMNRNNLAKRKGGRKWAKENGWEYLVVTEREIAAVSHIILLEEAAQMPGVVLNDKAQRALRRKMAKRSRMTRKKR